MARTRPLGVNTWVWTSPLTDASLREIAPRVAGWGFDVLELPVEDVADWNPQQAAGVLDDHGLGASVSLVMGPGRELVAADAGTIRRTQDYLRQVVDLAHTVGSRVIGGPAYASVGRTWRLTPASARPRTPSSSTTSRPSWTTPWRRGCGSVSNP